MNTNVVAQNLNKLAVKNVEIANYLVNASKNATGMNKSKLQNAASLNANVANKIINNANNVMAANQAANAAMTSAVNLNVNTKLDGQRAATAVAESTMKVVSEANFGAAGANSVANAAISAAAKVSSETDPNVAALNVANASLKASKKVETNMLEKSINLNTNGSKNLANNARVNNNNVNSNVTVTNKLVKSANNMQKNAVKLANTPQGKVGPMNRKFVMYAPVKKTNNSFLMTANGNVVKFNSKAKKAITHPSAKKQYVPFNAKNNKLNTQVYKQGELKNIYKNKKGVYTKATGFQGNVKNYLYSGMNTGLFGNKMV